jgi:hypothetical protein
MKVCPTCSQPVWGKVLTTYQVTCVRCRQERWPALEQRPARYLCAQCRARRDPLGTPSRHVERKRRAQEGKDSASTNKSSPGGC